LKGVVYEIFDLKIDDERYYFGGIINRISWGTSMAVKSFSVATESVQAKKP
jgi:hypothetical protein